MNKDKRHIDLLIKLFKIIDLKISHIDDINGVEIERELLKDVDIISKYNSMIPELKGFYNSDMFSCLHKNSLNKQKNPGVCMLRQISKANNYKMIPKTYNMGYNKLNGKKIVKRTYLFTKVLV